MDFDPSNLPNLLEQPLDHVKALLTREVSYGIEEVAAFLTNPAKEGATFRDWLEGMFGRAVLAELEQFGKMGTRKIGEQRRLGELSDLQHKLAHGFMAAWTQGAITFTKGIIHGDLSPERVLLLAGAAGGGAMLAEYFGEVFQDYQLKNIMGDQLQEDTLPEALDQINAQSRDMAKYITIFAGMLTGDEEAMRAMHHAGARAVDNNLICEALLLSSIFISAYDAYQAYQEGGVEEAGWSIAKDLGISLVVTGAGKLTFKVITQTGPKIVKSIREALRLAAQEGKVTPKVLEKAAEWNYDKFSRGKRLEKIYGLNLHKNFPRIDSLKNGVATSIKSLDLTSLTGLFPTIKTV